MANKRNMKGLISDIIDKNKSIYRYDDLESTTEDEVNLIINSVVNDNDPFGYGCTNKEKVARTIQIVISHYIDGLTYSQIGKNMGLSPSHISSMGNSGLRSLALRIIRHRNQKELVKPITVEETLANFDIDWEIVWCDMYNKGVMYPLNTLKPRIALAINKDPFYYTNLDGNSPCGYLNRKKKPLKTFRDVAIFIEDFRNGKVVQFPRNIYHESVKELMQWFSQFAPLFEGTGIMINEKSDSKHYISEEEYQAFEEEIRKLIKMHLPRVSELDIKRTLIPALEQLNVCIDKPIVRSSAYME